MAKKTATKSSKLNENIKSSEKDLSDLSDSLTGDGFKSYKKELTTTEHHLYLSDEIDGTADYSALCHRLRSFVAQDVVLMFVGCFGGSAHQAARIVNAMRQCPAFIKVIVEAPSYSAGTMIALAGDDLQLCHNTFLMFHNYSGGEFGKGKELLDSVVRAEQWLRVLYTDIYYPFLTEEELQSLSRDHDITVHWHEKSLQARLKRHFKYHRRVKNHE